MIVADRKNIPEIRDLIRKHDRVLLVGCGTCVTVCLAGGEREVGILGSALRMSLKLAGRGKVQVDECVIERQCEDAFIDILAGPRSRIRRRLLVGLRGGRAGPGRAFPQDARLSGAEHAVHRHPGIARRLDREVRRLRQLPARRVCRHLPHHPLCQASAQRAVRRVAGRQVRSQSGFGVRLATDLRSGRLAGHCRFPGADRAPARLVHRPRRRTAQSGPRRPVHRRARAEDLTCIPREPSAALPFVEIERNATEDVPRKASSGNHATLLKWR